MKKIMAIVVCCCFLLSSFTFAVSNDSYKVKLPSDFVEFFETESGAMYVNEDMAMTVAITKAEFGTYFKDAKVLLEENDFTLFMYGLGNGSDLEKINGVNYIKEVVSDEDGEAITYLGTTGSRLALIIFTGDNLDANKVEDIMDTFKLKGIPAPIAGFFGEYGIDLIVVVIIGLGIFIKHNRKAKKLEKELEEAAKQETANSGFENIAADGKTYYSDPTSQKKDEWNL